MPDPNLEIAQPGDCLIILVGLDATPTGTDANFDVVADFTGATQIITAPNSMPNPYTVVNDQAQGTTVKINNEGIYIAQFLVQCQTAAAVLAACGINNAGTELSANPPQLSTSILARGLRIAAGADTDALVLTTRPFAVNRNDAKSPTTALIRGLLSNNANAGAAAASLVLPSCALQIARIGGLPGGQGG